MTESTGLEARTIHRLLEVDPRTGGFRRDERNPLDGDLVVVDETSMVDVPLMHALLRAVPPHAALLLVGDVDQLPSVGPGAGAARHHRRRARVPVVRLTEVFRQAAESWIVRAAHRINQGVMPEWPPAGRAAISSSWMPTNPKTRSAASCRSCRERIPQRFGLDPVRDVQVLCPMNRGGLGARALNARPAAGAEPGDGAARWSASGGPSPSATRSCRSRTTTTRTSTTATSASSRAIDPDQQTMTIDFDGRPVDYDFGELDRVALAYATRSTKPRAPSTPRSSSR